MPFYLIADAGHVAQRARLVGADVKITETEPAGAVEAFDKSLPIVPLGEKITAAPGRPDATSGPAAIASIRRAVDDVLKSAAAAVVTNPIAKDVMYGAGFTDPGHTEYLARLAQQAAGKTVRPVMLLWSDDLAVVPVTIHEPLKDVPQLLTTTLIVETGRIVARELAARFGIARPRLALTGLNPHAGENGTIGSEEAKVIAPAIAQLAAEGINARGPLPADTLFHAAARKTYDVALCMYHDQALIPVKMLAFDRAVNVTLGLPFVRTSPDHGTAFDIAGTGRANPGSLIAALQLAARLTQQARVPVSA
jgi:4-hydroxythreonine-4-phosphate dehydrogenase